MGKQINCQLFLKYTSMINCAYLSVQDKGREGKEKGEAGVNYIINEKWAAITVIWSQKQEAYCV